MTSQVPEALNQSATVGTGQGHGGTPTDQGQVLPAVGLRHPLPDLHEHGLQSRVDGGDELVQLVAGRRSCDHHKDQRANHEDHGE